jgi:hypothetical protein
MINLFAHVFSFRLDKIINDKALQLQGEMDTCAKVMNELQNTQECLHIENTELHKEVLRLLVISIQRKLIALIHKNGNDSEIASYCRQLLFSITQKGQRGWSAIITDLVESAKAYETLFSPNTYASPSRKKLSQSEQSLFSNSKTKEDSDSIIEMREYCRKLAILTELVIKNQLNMEKKFRE